MYLTLSVEPARVELATSCLQNRRSSIWAMTPNTRLFRPCKRSDDWLTRNNIRWPTIQTGGFLPHQLSLVLRCPALFDPTIIQSIWTRLLDWRCAHGLICYLDQTRTGNLRINHPVLYPHWATRLPACTNRGKRVLAIPHCERLTCLQIELLRFVFVSLTLEGYIAISVAGFRQSIQPFEEVQNVEKQVAKLLHLCSVDFFVIQQPLRDYSFRTHKQNSKKIDCRKARKRYEPIAYYFHFLIFYMFAESGEPLSNAPYIGECVY